MTELLTLILLYSLSDTSTLLNISFIIYSLKKTFQLSEGTLKKKRKETLKKRGKKFLKKKLEGNCQKNDEGSIAKKEKGNFS